MFWKERPMDSSNKWIKPLKELEKLYKFSFWGSGGVMDFEARRETNHSNNYPFQ